MAQASPNPARRAALALLESVTQRHRALEEALDALPMHGRPHRIRGAGETRPGAALEARDKAAGHRIAAMVLRRAGSLDAVLEPYLRREPPPAVRNALRIGAAELLLLATPAHAAVGNAVDLVPPAFAGLVNAILRKLAAAGPALLEGIDGERLDTPPWLWASWHAAYGAAVRAIAHAHRQEAPLDLSLKPGAIPPPGGVLLPTGSWRYPAGTRVTDLPGYATGDFWVQDAAAALPARLLGPRPGERIADLGAAPGGKTAQIASAGARVTAIERDPRRIQRLTQNLARLRLDATLIEADLQQFEPAERFDAVLLDAPCSATGTMRRHPDLPFLKRPQDIPGFVQAQAAMLKKAASLVSPGGRLVFATCSLQPEEGEGHLATAATLGLVLDPVLPAELPGLPEAVSATGTVRTRPDFWPAFGGIDGFFIARFRRPA